VRSSSSGKLQRSRSASSGLAWKGQYKRQIKAKEEEQEEEERGLSRTFSVFLRCALSVLAGFYYVGFFLSISGLLGST